MSDRQSEENGSHFDGIQFGVMIGKLDTLITRFDRFESDIKNSYATKERVTTIEKRVTELEEQPKRKVANWIAGIASLASVAAVVISLVSIYH